MAYIATLASRLSQLGVTDVEFNLVDNAAVMPPVRRAWTFQTLTPSGAQVTAARAVMIADATSDYNTEQTRLANEAAFHVRLTDYIEAQLDTVRSNYAAQVASSGLPQAAKDIANRVVFNWSLQ